MKATLTLRTVALLCLGSSPGALAQDLFIHQTSVTPAGSMFLLTSGSTSLQGWFSVDGVSTGALGNEVYSRAVSFAPSALESMHVIYVDSNSSSSPSCGGVFQGFATVPGEVGQVALHGATEVIGGTSSLLGGFAGDTNMHDTLSGLNDFHLSVSPLDSLASGFSYSSRFTAN